MNTKQQHFDFVQMLFIDVFSSFLSTWFISGTFHNVCMYFYTCIIIVMIDDIYKHT